MFSGAHIEYLGTRYLWVRLYDDESEAQEKLICTIKPHISA